MKKLLLIIAVIAVIAGCNKKETTKTDNGVNWNGYENLKYSTQTVPLYAGQTIEVGYMTYVITEDPLAVGGYNSTAVFIATYHLENGWTMSESNLYAGGLDELPVNKPGAPKVGRFNYKTDHDPAVTEFTYTIPVTELPAYDATEEDSFTGGFVVAAHCVVSNPQFGTETGWADGGHSFSDKGWGSYLDTFLSNPNNHVTDIIYGINYDENDGSLSLSHINTDNGDDETIMTETISIGSGSVSGAAFDDNTRIIYFTVGNTLYANNLNNDSGTETVGVLPSTPTGGAFYDGSYYYYDSNSNSIIEVNPVKDENGWTISTVSIPLTGFDLTGVTVIDIAISSDGSTFYLLVNDGADVILLSFTSSGTYESTTSSSLLSNATQITVGADGLLYVVEVDPTTGDANLFTIDPNTGDNNNSEDNDITILDPSQTFVGGPSL